MIQRATVLLLAGVLLAGCRGETVPNGAWGGDHVVLAVSDRGPGVSPGEEARVFEKFYRGAAASTNDGGMGLGLTICRAVAEAHGGSIRVANRAGGGLCVTTSLPRVRRLTRAEPALHGAEAG